MLARLGYDPGSINGEVGLKTNMAISAFQKSLGERGDGLPSEATSSLQRDVMQGRPSELDAQLGAVSRMARAAGVETPVCDVMLAMLLPQEAKARAG